jgi:hypothetical protein
VAGRREGGTGDWLVKHQDFAAFVNGEMRVL